MSTASLPSSSLLWSDFCQEVNTDPANFSWPSHLHDLSVSERSSDLTVSGMWPLCYSWIGYRQANGPPRALRSKSVDHQGANIVKTQIARTLQWSQFLTDTDRYSIVIVPAASCSLLLIAAWLCFTSETDGSQGPCSGVFYPWLTADIDVPVVELMLIFPVIMPHMKHASSLATAVTATFFFLPWRIIL